MRAALQSGPEILNASTRWSAEHKAQLVAFAGRNGEYYADQVSKIHARSTPAITFNWAAMLLGPIWCGYRKLWGLLCILMIVELIALVPLAQGVFSDLGAEHRAKIERLEKNEQRMLGLAAEARQAGDSEKAASLKRNAENLARARAKSQAALDATGRKQKSLIAFGLVALVLVRLFEGLIANPLYADHFEKWRSNRTLPSGTSVGRAVVAAALAASVYGLTLYRFTSADPPQWLAQFPIDNATLHDPAERGIESALDYAIVNYAAVFDQIRAALRWILNGLEQLFVGTPWPVVMTVIAVMAWRMAGPRTAIFTLSSITYIAVLGYWERAMSTVALLGTAAAICILIGIPLGIWFSRSDRAYQFGRPVLDFMQTMPAFVYLIPVIAFFGTGKPPGILVAIIFGLPPIVRLTNLGLREVPADLKEAAAAFGASRFQILRDVELPQASTSIMAGINQTVLFCLSAIVIAALIGAKGLGQDVLQALQYASKGQGVLAGVAILLCAMVIDRTVQVVPSSHKPK